ncbi:hypothetical protein [Tumebacillus permanentifrigoris]|uniref:Uncharacterized protein n=1 Tax=Tumebacillus permanentifrigoris TaxID=378543 RepID=A0A316D3Z5_9BACL|nr:hypothetical protein [Tumebacillus permanentifrigoris]PWK05081.1 hypothetical protein C7459_12713 [Tumebacillus permanentifrigoris]
MPEVAKPSHGRGSQKRRDRTKITPNNRKHVQERSEGLCERCAIYCLKLGGQMAHLEGAGQLGRGDIPWNICLLCLTCHKWADGTAEGYEWRRERRVELVLQYSVRICARPLCREETDKLDALLEPICKTCSELYPERMPGRSS